jgi:ketosteroid isomerase-like protein
MTMTDDQKQQLAWTFLSVLSAPDEDVVKRVAVEGVIWTFPGSSPIAGEAHGVAGVVKRGRMIAGYGVKVEILHAVYGRDGAAMILHNTATTNGRVLDERVAAVFAFRGDKIARLDTYLSDVPMADAFFC